MKHFTISRNVNRPSSSTQFCDHQIVAVVSRDLQGFQSLKHFAVRFEALKVSLQLSASVHTRLHTCYSSFNLQQ